MLIWLGWGVLVPVILGVALFVLPMIVQAVAGDEVFYEHFDYIFRMSLILGAVVIWFLGKKLNGRKGRIVTDDETGEKIELKSTNSFFFIKMEYWAIPIIAFVIFSLFAGT